MRAARALAERIGRALERAGLPVRDIENNYLGSDAEAGGAMRDLYGHSITYRVAVGLRAGQKVFSLQTVPAPSDDEPKRRVAQWAGFSLHAGTGVEAEQREKLERLARYVTRPAVAEGRLALTPQGQVRYGLKTPYRDGTTHIVLEPLDFIARLAALVPPPRAHLARYHGVFAPHAALRAAITPAGRGRGARQAPAAEHPTPKHISMNWMARLKRVFAIDIERAGPSMLAITLSRPPQRQMCTVTENAATGGYDAELTVGIAA